MSIAAAQLLRPARAAWSSLSDPDARSRDYHIAELARLGASVDVVSTRAANWVDRLHGFEAFWSNAGRHPRENTRDRSAIPTDERRLGEWARYQRRFEEDLCDYQRARLDLSPAFDWDPLDSAWERKLNAVGGYVHRIGRLPILTSTDSDEFRSARWLGRQTQARRDGRLTAQRARAIDELLATSGRRGCCGGTFRPD